MKTFLIKIIFALIFLLSPFVALASSNDNMSGYAWSSNIGWISFNCTNDNSCGTSNYGVNKNPGGTLTGYAWSPNIGWIQFGGFSDNSFPSGGAGTQAKNAEMEGNNLKGWAKVIGADGNGWDGWISFSGAGPSYSITLTGNTFNGYAWGSSVVGWINFNTGTNGVKIGPANPTTPGFNISGPSSLHIQFLGNNGADSEIGAYFVDNGGTPYNLPVTISIDPITPSLPSGITILYSLDSGVNFSNSPTAVISNYSSGVGLRVRLSKSVNTTTYTMHIKGTGQDGKTATRDVTISSVLFNPQFEEF